MKANTKLQVLRGSQVTTPLGDVEDTDRVILDGIPAFIKEIQFRRDRNSGSATNTDAFCRVAHGTDIRIGDRVSTHDGQTYLVRGKQKTRIVNNDLLLDLERISGNLT